MSLKFEAIKTHTRPNRVFQLIYILLTCNINLAADLKKFSLPMDCSNINQTTACDCDLNWPLRISCPRIEISRPFIYSSPSSGFSIQIECSQMTPQDFADVPSIDFNSDIESVRIKNCSLSEDARFNEIFVKLGLSRQKEIYYENNIHDETLTRLHLNVFENLEILHLELQNRGQLTEDFFDDMGRLKYLYIHQPNTKLTANLFAPLRKMKVLNVTDSNLIDMPINIFRNQHLLYDLELSGNDIEVLEPNSLKPLRYLRRIYLNSNKLKELPNGLFTSNGIIEKVQLQNNSMSKLPTGLLSNLIFLKSVNLSLNFLESIPEDTFYNSWYIENIFLQNNLLELLPETLFDTQINMKRLDLSYNRLTDLPDNLFENTRNLEVLNLSNNRLKTITSMYFPQLELLKELYISNNELKGIDTLAFHYTRDLHTIELQNNLLEFGRGKKQPFLWLSNLEVLNLRNNSISNFADALDFVPSKLRFLDLNFNNISSFPVIIHQEQLLINLTHNQISSINYFSLQYSVHEKLTIDINNNPLNCNCKLKYFVEVLNGVHKKDTVDNIRFEVDNLNCHEPENMKSKLVLQLSPFELECSIDTDCPLDCRCSKRTSDSTYIIDCSNKNLTYLPAWMDAKMFNLNGKEINMTNNSLSELPSINVTGYADFTKLLLAGNQLEDLFVGHLPPKIELLDLRFIN